MPQLNITLDSDIVKELFLSQAPEALVALLESVLNQCLEAQATEAVGAEKYERSEERTCDRHGSRERPLKTRIATITLDVPRLRGGEFSHELFARYQRSEQALVLAMMEMVLQGVSTRKVNRITEELCGTSFYKSTVSALCKGLDESVQAFRQRRLKILLLDAMVLKVREGGRVRSKALMIAIGVDREGYREVFLGASWQRCQVHFTRNIQDACLMKGKLELLEDLRELWDSREMAVARERLSMIMEKYAKLAPKSMVTLEQGFDDAMAVMNLPVKYRRRLRTTNVLERLNQEVRRREWVIRIFRMRPQRFAS